jgi:pyruvate/2-oxoglutarate/acetoin dehydrogenase E1 component
MGSWVSNLELFIALELADAGDLASMIKHFKGKEKPLPEASIWKFFVQICAGVNHMHEKRIMHRGKIHLCCVFTLPHHAFVPLARLHSDLYFY